MSEKIIECSKCGEVFKSKAGLVAHRPTCQKMPIGEELAREFDANPLFTVKDAAKKYHVTPYFIHRRLKNTRWHHDRLARRGHLVASFYKRNSKDKHAQQKRVIKGEMRTDPCARCQLLARTWGRIGLCPDCQADLARIWKRLKRGRIRYRLNEWDLNWLVGGLS